MDNERPIEKLLRRFAKQRREDSEANVKLHPATRRLLQGEVARRFPKASAQDKASTGAFPALWAKLAYGLCAVAVVAVIVAIQFPSLNRTKSAVQLAKMDQSTAVESEAASAGEQRIAPAVTPAPAERPGMDGAKRLEESDLAVAKLEKTANEPQRAMTISTTKEMPSDGKPYSDEYKQAASADRQRRDVALFSNTGSIQTRAAVLNSFHVEQVGDELRVIDEDGSTYTGNIQTVAIAAQSGPQVAGSLIADAPSEGAKTPTKDKGVIPATSNDSVSQKYSFRVSGFNNTLRQNVIFEGNLIPTNETLRSQAPASAQPQQQFQNVQHLINSSVIIGRAQVENEKAIEINATPAGP